LRDKTQYFEIAESTDMICILHAAAVVRENIRQIVARMACLNQPCLVVIVYYNILNTTMISVSIWRWRPQNLHKYFSILRTYYFLCPNTCI